MGTQAQYFFGGRDKEISEKRNFFVNRSVPKIFPLKIFQGKYPRNPNSLRIQKMYMVDWVQQIFDPVLVA